MWVRSQDRKRLLEVDNICIKYTFTFAENEKNELYQIPTKFHIHAGEYELGTYSTEEKALKVLDVIQVFIKSMYVGNGEYMGYPFQIPKDDEV